MPPGSAGVLRVGFGVSPKQSCLGSAGCQPASLGSLPRLFGEFIKARAHRVCCRQAADNCRLAACAPQIPQKRREKEGESLLRALFEGSRLTAQKSEGFTGEMEGAGNQDPLAGSLRSGDGFGNGWSDGVGE